MLYFYLLIFFFFFKQKTAYEMRISDWSSDVCSSDLGKMTLPITSWHADEGLPNARPLARCAAMPLSFDREDRKSVVSGKSVSVRVDLGGRRIIKKKRKSTNIYRYNMYNRNNINNEYQTIVIRTDTSQIRKN